MSGERPKNDDPQDGFRLRSLSGEAEEAEIEEAPRLADAPTTTKATPISDAHVMSDAEVSEVKAGRERQIQKAQARVSMKSFGKVLALLVVILAVIVGLASLHDSGATTGSTTPTPSAPQGKTPAPPATTKNPKKRGKKATEKPHKKSSRSGKKGKPAGIHQVKLIPPAKGPGKSADNPDSEGTGSPTINGIKDQEIGHADKLIAKAAKILEAKKYPASYRKRPSLLKKYLEEQLDYPVVLTTVTDRHDVLGMSIMLPIGKVLLTHLQKGDLAPQLTWVKLWKPEY